MTIDHTNPLIEVMCRALCREEGIDPDKVHSSVRDVCEPGGWKMVPNWRAKVKFCADLYRQQIALDALKQAQEDQRKMKELEQRIEWDRLIKEAEEKHGPNPGTINYWDVYGRREKHRPQG